MMFCRDSNMADSEKQTKPKPIIAAGRAIGWYYGNFLMSPNNALRGAEGYMERANALVDKLRAELKNQKMTHKEFLDLMKEKGIHDKYYRYRKYVNDCPLCRALGSG